MQQPTTATSGVYCRKCGYDLRASAEAKRCPECGRAFSPDDPKTFRPRPFAALWKRALARWANRLAILLLVLGLPLGGTWGWFYWGWRQEQAALAALHRMEEKIPLLVILGGEPGRWLHDRHVPGSFVLERVRDVVLTAPATDADLLLLRKLTELRALSVDGPITDAGLAHLRHCPRLRGLSLRGSRLTDAGFAVLRDLSHLEGLQLDAVRITDAGLGHVAFLPGLKYLGLVRMPLTDAGLVHLDKLTALKYLNLRNTPVTDAGLGHLEKLPALKELSLNGTKVTPAGVARLKAALPGCEILGP